MGWPSPPHWLGFDHKYFKHNFSNDLHQNNNKTVPHWLSNYHLLKGDSFEGHFENKNDKSHIWYHGIMFFVYLKLGYSTSCFAVEIPNWFNSNFQISPVAEKVASNVTLTHREEILFSQIGPSSFFCKYKIKLGEGGRDLIQSNRSRTHFFPVNSPLWFTKWSLSPCLTGQIIQWLGTKQIQDKPNMQIQLEYRQNTNLTPCSTNIKRDR